MSDDLSPDDARAALAAAEASSARVRGPARWMSVYLGVFGVAFGVLTLLLGMVQGRPARAVLLAGWAVLCLGVVAWAARRPAHLAGTAARTGRYWMLTAVLYGIALAVGLPQDDAGLGYWLPAAVVVALPMLIGAVREARA